MSGEPRDPWRLGALERLGAQFRDLETAGANTGAQATGRRRRRLSLSPGLSAALIAILALVLTGRVASARSPVNLAPAAAAAADSVHFRSVITVLLGGRKHERFTEQGAIDFDSGDFSTTLSLGHTAGTVERRITGGVFYIAQVHRGARPARGVQWLGLRLALGRRASFSSASSGDAFTDPLVLFAAMARTRAPVTALGHASTGGVRTTHYRLFTDLATFLRASSSRGEAPAPYRKVAATLDVWLDSAGRPRRVNEAFAGDSSLGAARITTRIDFTGYGQPVTVRAPANASVTSERPIATPGPLVADPARLFERLLAARR